MSNSTAPMLLPPSSADIDRGSALQAMYWTMTAASIILLAARLYTRIKLKSLGIDDWFMTFTVFQFLMLSIFVTIFTEAGGARHIFYLQPDQALKAVKWSWIAQPWGIFIFATGKAAVAFLIIRILGPASFWRKRMLWFAVISVCIINALGCIFTFAQCDPPAALWTPSLAATAKCWDPTVQEHFNYFLAAWNIFLDFFLALLPVTIIYNLNISLKKKITICALLGLGIVASAFSIVKTTYLFQLAGRTDFTWNLYDVEAWVAAECFVMIICGNIPPLQPLWERFVSQTRDAQLNKIYDDNSQRREANYGQGESSQSGKSGNSTLSSTHPDQGHSKNVVITTEIEMKASPRSLV